MVGVELVAARAVAIFVRVGRRGAMPAAGRSSKVSAMTGCAARLRAMVVGDPVHICSMISQRPWRTAVDGEIAAGGSWRLPVARMVSVSRKVPES